MRKILICFIIITIGFSCTKEQMRLCGCSPVNYNFSLILKNQQGKDLLDPAVTGSFDKSAIKIQYKENNVLKDVSFTVRPPFNYGTDAATQFPFYQIYSSELPALKVSNKAQEFYISFGSNPTDTLSFDYNSTRGYAENVEINGVLQNKETSLPDRYGSIYFIAK